MTSWSLQCSVRQTAAGFLIFLELYNNLLQYCSTFGLQSTTPDTSNLTRSNVTGICLVLPVTEYMFQWAPAPPDLCCPPQCPGHHLTTHISQLDQLWGSGKHFATNISLQPTPPVLSGLSTPATLQDIQVHQDRIPAAQRPQLTHFSVLIILTKLRAFPGPTLICQTDKLGQNTKKMVLRHPVVLFLSSPSPNISPSSNISPPPQDPS